MAHKPVTFQEGLEKKGGLNPPPTNYRPPPPQSFTIRPSGAQPEPSAPSSPQRESDGQ